MKSSESIFIMLESSVAAQRAVVFLRTQNPVKPLAHETIGRIEVVGQDTNRITRKVTGV